MFRTRIRLALWQIMAAIALLALLFAAARASGDGIVMDILWLAISASGAYFFTRALRDSALKARNELSGAKVDSHVQKITDILNLFLIFFFLLTSSPLLHNQLMALALLLALVISSGR